MVSNKQNKADKKYIKDAIARNKKIVVRVPKAVSPAPVQPEAVAPGPVTPEQEHERVLVNHQGAHVEMVIFDRTIDGKFTKIGETKADAQWKPTDSIQIAHRFTDSKK